MVSFLVILWVGEGFGARFVAIPATLEEDSKGTIIKFECVGVLSVVHAM